MSDTSTFAHFLFLSVIIGYHDNVGEVACIMIYKCAISITFGPIDGMSHRKKEKLSSSQAEPGQAIKSAVA